MKAKKSRQYLDPNELYDEIMNWRNSHKEIEKRIPSEKLGNIFLSLAGHMLQNAKFSGYSVQIKEDMRSYALYKMIRGLKTFKPNPENKKQAFSYFTRACWISFITVLGKHYKYENLKRDLTKEYLRQHDTIDPRIKEQMLKNLNDID